MNDPQRTVRDMVAAGATVSQLVDHLRVDDSFVLTPFNFTLLIVKSLGVTMQEARQLLIGFDPEMRPLNSVDDVDRNGDEVLARFRGGDVGQ